MPAKSTLPFDLVADHVMLVSSRWEYSDLNCREKHNNFAIGSKSTASRLVLIRHRFQGRYFDALNVGLASARSAQREVVDIGAEHVRNGDQKLHYLVPDF